VSTNAPDLHTIDSAIRGVLEGSLGSIRTVPMGMFSWALLDRVDLEKEQKDSIDTQRARYRFDITFGAFVEHESSGESLLSNRRVVITTITIPVVCYLLSRASDDERAEARRQMGIDLITACQALNFPDNVRFAADGTTPTEIVGGELRNVRLPLANPIAVDWERHLLRSTITAEAIVVVTQDI
jgi:hypothetical protein